jgi:RNA polymerase-binding protein DksA
LKQDDIMSKAKSSKTAESKKIAAKEKPAAKIAKKPAAPAAKAKPAPAAKKPAAEPKAAAKKKKKGDTEIIARPAPAPVIQETPRPSIGFSNAGLGIKTAAKKPGLSVAPGVMILGKSAAAKTEIVARPSDRRLSKKELGDIKHFLLERRERLLAGMRRELAMQRERAESKAADEVDKATDAYDEDLSFEIAAANDQELGEIQIALEKIDKGTYGECEVCGCGISPSRLKILPSATTCVSCRDLEEQARRRDDGSPAFTMLGNEDTEIETDVN